jgi:hypothetical protein
MLTEPFLNRISYQLAMPPAVQQLMQLQRAQQWLNLQTNQVQPNLLPRAQALRRLKLPNQPNQFNLPNQAKDNHCQLLSLLPRQLQLLAKKYSP